MLALFTLVGICSILDRSIVAIVLEPIKLEFHLSDSQLGIIAGLAFAIAHALVAIPAGALGDRISRNKLIAASLFVWSAMTFLCGIAQSFIQLVIGRMGIGAGEAGAQAATLSSVADLFPPERRATAISIFYLSSPIGSAIAGIGGGLIAANYGWRTAVIAASIPGILLCFVMLLTSDVPRETVKRPAEEKASDAPGLLTVLRFISRRKSILHILTGLALVTLSVAGPSIFAYSFFIRVHGMNLKEIGPILGITSGALGIAMMLASGFVADWLGKRDARRRLWFIVVVLVSVTPFVIAGFIVPQPYAIPLFLTHVLLVGFWTGPAFATVQNLSHPRMRSTIAGIMYVVLGFVGFGLGPVVVGQLSDILALQVGADAGLRWALCICTGLGFWSALHFSLATRTLTSDLERTLEMS